MADGPERWAHRWAWSWFRRRHQAGAKRGHTARRAGPPRATADPPVQTLAAAPPALTDARWARIAPLLPSGAATGRPPRDHRTVLTGILWVIRTGASWSELPAAFGSWSTVHGRYQRWRRDGTWERILEVLLAPVT